VPKSQSLSKVTNREGRLDVLLYEAAGKLMDRLERQNGLTGIREHLLPIIEQAILEGVPGRNVIPPELRPLFRVYALNNRSKSC
jgi:hypothetical protein